MRRLLLVTSNFGGGTGRHLVGVLDHLSQERWKAEILCQGRREVEQPPHVGLIEFPRSGWTDRFPLAQVRRLNQLRHHVVTWSPDVVHAYFFWPIVYGRLLRRLGLIRHLVENREDQGFNLDWWNYRVLRATAHLPDRVICVSEAVRQTVLDREGVEERRAVVVHNGVALPELSAATTGDVRRELGLSASDLVVGLVSNLNRAVKGVQYLIDSMPLILKRVPDTRFLIVGGGPDERALRARAREAGVGDRAIFVGFRSDIERIYPIMDVSVLTSLSEGLSMTLLESMSYGLPVVATRVGGNPELVRHGRTGYLVPARDPAAFAERVVELLRDESLRKRMGREGRRVVESEFSLERTAGRYEDVYASVLSEASVH